jgi:hypothetical protein
MAVDFESELARALVAATENTKPTDSPMNGNATSRLVTIYLAGPGFFSPL